MDGENKANHVVLNLNETYELEGVYWYDVFIDDILITRMPFQITYMRLSSG
jgi:hypothetical protein